MTCRNYIPGPNGEDVLNALRGLHKAVKQLSEHFDKPITDENIPLWLALNSAQAHAEKVLSNGDCQRCGEMRAGHAGPGVVEIEQMMSGAGHAGSEPVMWYRSGYHGERQSWGAKRPEGEGWTPLYAAPEKSK